MLCRIRNEVIDKLTKKDVYELLLKRHEDNEYKKLQSLPLPFQLRDATKGALRVKEAIDKNEVIVIVGDYDVDGIVSTAIMIEFFEKIGVEVFHFIPNRFRHGYGLSPKVIQELVENYKKIDIVITVDNGISSFEAAQICKQNGIDLIITDHHTVGDILPDAYAIINPKREDCSFPCKNICGAQVAWYFCAALKHELQANVDMAQFFDLLCVAIISDMMPMKSLNYTIAKKGLRALSGSKRASFNYLFGKFSRQNIKSDDIGFLLSPLLNSAGRLDDPLLALQFILSKTYDEASERLDKLIALNEKRKTLQKDAFCNAITKVDDSPVICVWSEVWNEGVIGIIASNLAQKFKKPAFVFSIKEGIAKGSARNLGDANLYDLINLSSEHLIGFGGHKSAAGMSLAVEKLEDFKTSLCQSYQKIKDTSIIQTEDGAFGILNIEDIDLDLVEIVHEFEPFGVENEKPIFLIDRAKIKKITLFGKNLEYSKLILENNNSQCEVLFFDDATDYSEGDFVGVTITVSINNFFNEPRVQILAKQIFKL